MDPENQLSRHSSGLPIVKPGNILDSAMANLSADQQNKLVVKAIEERLKIDSSEKAADLRDRTSSKDMVNTVGLVRALDQNSKSDYNVQATFETASGNTRVEVKKNNNTVIIVVAVVIGIVFLALFSK